MGNKIPLLKTGRSSITMHHYDFEKKDFDDDDTSIVVDKYKSYVYEYNESFEMMDTGTHMEITYLIEPDLFPDDDIVNIIPLIQTYVIIIMMNVKLYGSLNNFCRLYYENDIDAINYYTKCKYAKIVELLKKELKLYKNQKIRDATTHIKNK